MSNRLEPDQSLHFVGSDQVPNSLQRLSADISSNQKVKVLNKGHEARKPDFVACEQQRCRPACNICSLISTCVVHPSKE